MVIPPDYDGPAPPFVPASVNVTPTYLLTGTGAGYWNVTMCSAGVSNPGAAWLCGFSMRVGPGACVFVDKIATVGAAEISITPTLPQGACTEGELIGFGLTIQVPSSGTSSIELQVILDSHT